MKIKVIQLHFILLFVLPFVIEVSGQEVKSFQSPDSKYSILLPNNWVRDYSKNALVGMLFSYDSLHFEKRIAISTSASVALSLNEAYRTTMRGIKNDKGNKIEKEGSDHINGEETKWAIYSFLGKGGRAKVKIYVMRKNRTNFSIQAILPEEQFDAEVEQFDRIIKTFTIN